MKARLLHEVAGQRTFAVVLETGDEVMQTLQRFLKDEHVTAAQLTGIGAFSDAHGS